MPRRLPRGRRGREPRDVLAAACRRVMSRRLPRETLGTARHHAAAGSSGRRLEAPSCRPRRRVGRRQIAEAWTSTSTSTRARPRRMRTPFAVRPSSVLARPATTSVNKPYSSPRARGREIQAGRTGRGCGRRDHSDLEAIDGGSLTAFSGAEQEQRRPTLCLPRATIVPIAVAFVARRPRSARPRTRRAASATLGSRPRSRRRGRAHRPPRNRLLASSSDQRVPLSTGERREPRQRLADRPLRVRPVERDAPSRAVDRGGSSPSIAAPLLSTRVARAVARHAAAVRRHDAARREPSLQASDSAALADRRAVPSAARRRHSSTTPAGSISTATRSPARGCSSAVVDRLELRAVVAAHAEPHHRAAALRRDDGRALTRRDAHRLGPDHGGAAAAADDVAHAEEARHPVVGRPAQSSSGVATCAMPSVDGAPRRARRARTPRRRRA